MISRHFTTSSVINLRHSGLPCHGEIDDLNRGILKKSGRTQAIRLVAIPYLILPSNLIGSHDFGEGDLISRHFTTIVYHQICGILYILCHGEIDDLDRGISKKCGRTQPLENLNVISVMIYSFEKR